jgi:hypothetical protein
MKQLISAFSILLLIACASTPEYGVGPVELTSGQQNFYKQYLNRMNERKDKKEDWAFAISPTQNYARYIFKRGGNLIGAKDKALRLCNEGVKVKDCKIYDINGKVVWKFDETVK